MSVVSITAPPRPSPSALRLMTRFLAAQWWRVVAAVLAGVLTILSSVALLSVSAWLIERASQRPPILTLMVAIVAVRFFGIGRGVFRYTDRYLAHDASFRLLAGIRGEIYRSLIPLAPAGLHDLGHGDLLSRIAADVDTVQEWFVRGFAPVCVSVVTLLVIAAGAAIILPAAGVAVLLLLAGAGLLAASTGRTRNAHAAEEMRLRGAVTAETVGYIQGIGDLVAMGAAGSMAQRIEEEERKRDRLALHRAHRGALAMGLQTALPGLLAAALGAIALGRIAAGAGLDPLMIGVLVFGGMAAAECIAALPGAVESWERGLAAAGRLAALEARPLPVSSSGLTELSRRPRRLEVSSLTFDYGDGKGPVLNDVSLRIARGERVVIVGPSGAGKTTLAALLLRFLAPQHGSISLDGFDLENLTEGTVRQSIGAATQYAHLFAGTIRDNILLARPGAGDGDLRRVAGQAQLMEWIDSLPEGWTTEVGERGVAVSGGQRRRIALARALLADFPFLIADEPTEGLDDAAARAAMQDLFAATDDRGLIVITHRPDLCPKADATYRLESGTLHPVHMT